MDTSVYLQFDDTRVAIVIANQLLIDVLERGGIDDACECALLDLIDIRICPTLRVMQEWAELESTKGLPHALVRNTLMVLANALTTYTEQALALVSAQQVSIARRKITECRRTL
jgi:hypothetical protein